MAPSALVVLFAALPPLTRALAIPTARTVAHSVLLRCEQGGAFADRALASALSTAKLQPSDARLATELTYGVLRNARSLDFALAQLTSLNRTRVEDLVSLRVGTYELLHLRTPDHAAVSQAVDTARREGTRRFLNGVLRNVARRRASLRQPEDDPALSATQALGVRCSMPDWLLEELAATVLTEPAALEEWAAANQRAPRLALRVNPLRASAAELAVRLRAAGIGAEPVAGLEGQALLCEGGGEVARMPGFAQGEWSVQDPAAQLVALLAAPARGELVVDMCAAPGGKATHLAELQGDAGAVLAVELHARKLPLIEQAAARLGLASVTPRAADATDGAAVRALVAELRAARGEEAARLAEVVVVDAPCSGFGTLRRNPEHRAKGGEHLAGLHALQDRLLDSAAGVVGVGGRLVFAVCTPLAAECEERVAAFLRRHPNFALDPVAADDATLAPFAASGALLPHGQNAFLWSGLARHHGLP